MGKVDDGEIAWALVANNMNRTKAAEAAGVSRKTVQNRLQDPAFLELVEKAEAERAERFKAMGDNAVFKALEFLTEVLDYEADDPVWADYSTADKFRACSLILGAAQKVNLG